MPLVYRSGKVDTLQMNSRQTFCCLSLTLVTSVLVAFSAPDPAKLKVKVFVHLKHSSSPSLIQINFYKHLLQKAHRENWKGHEAVRTCHKIQHRVSSAQEEQFFICVDTQPPHLCFGGDIVC